MEEDNKALNTPLINESKDMGEEPHSPMLKSASEISLDSGNPTVEAAFKKVANIGKPLVDGHVTREHVDLWQFSKNGNIFYTIKREGKLALYSLQAERVTYEETQDGVSCLYITPMNLYYYVGYTNGVLESRDPKTMEKVTEVDFGDEIKAMISDDKTLYVSLANGKVIFMPCNDLQSQKIL